MVGWLWEFYDTVFLSLGRGKIAFSVVGSSSSILGVPYVPEPLPPFSLLYGTFGRDGYSSLLHFTVLFRVHFLEACEAYEISKDLHFHIPYNGYTCSTKKFLNVYLREWLHNGSRNVYDLYDS